ncbi:M20/M25/M40 family metallo-hydrolase, partial [Chloroflexota bacterium]
HLKRIGLTEENLCNSQRDPQSLAGYLELHIEQGALLHEDNIDIGIVNSIVGICSYEITYVGCANHAGTTSMESRLDASQGASAYTLAVRAGVIKEFPDCVANIGNLCIEPGAFNIIPERATASLEFRAPTVELLNLLETAMLDLAQEQADRFGLGLEIKFLGKHSPALMNSNIQAIFHNAAQFLCLSTIPLNSGAGHDAQSLANICPTGMIFVPSIDGISHSHQEFTNWQDCVNGANMLLLTVLELASQHSPT